MNRYFWIVLLLFFGSRGFAGDLVVKDSSGITLVHVKNNQVYQGDSGIQVLNIRGNIIYRGKSGFRDSMYLLVQGQEYFKKKITNVYRGNATDQVYLLRKGRSYLGDLINRDKLLFEVEADSNVYTIYSGLDGRVIGEVIGEEPSIAQWALITDVFNRVYKLDQQLAEAYQPRRLTDAVGAMVLLGTAGMEIWEWDGETLRLSSGFAVSSWSYDGQYIQKEWDIGRQHEWVWDGSVLKPYWNQDVKFQYMVTESYIKPFWNDDPSKEWTISDNEVFPTWGMYHTRRWRIEGEMPLPLIAMIVLGHVY